MKQTTKRIACYIAGFLCEKMIEFFIFLYEKTKNENQFEVAYTFSELVVLAVEIPRGTKLSLGSVKAVYPILSKRQIYKIIELRKKINKNEKKIDKQISIIMSEIMIDLA